MPHALSISFLVLSGLGLLLWVGSYCIPPLRRQEDITRFFVRCIFTLAGALFMVMSYRRNGLTRPHFVLFQALAFVAAIMVMWGRNIAGIFAAPFTSLFDSSERVKPEPMYSIAEARRKQGHIHEAMWEIQAQLEKFPNDFRGQMMLAEIQAENANDLPGAAATIHRICSQKQHGPGQVAAALTLLADWHMKYDQDVDAARAAFQEIAERYPDSELAQQAENRMAHLAEASTLVDARAPRTIQMPTVALPLTAEAHPDARTDGREEVERLVKHLTQFPGDIEAREELAKMYANEFGRLDLATDQLEQLIALPNESPKHVARWLNLLADLQVRCTADTQLAAATLQRIIERFPGHASADAARDRLQYLNLEKKRYEKERSVRLK